MTNTSIFSEMSCSPGPSPPLIWVTIGKTQHAARLLEEAPDGKKRVRWLTTQKIDWIDNDAAIETKLTPRRRRLLEAAFSSPSPPRSPKRTRRDSITSSSADTGESDSRRVSLDAPPISPQAKGRSDAKLASDVAAQSAERRIPGKEPSQEDADGDDSSIEILFSVMPPTPQKKAPTNKKPPANIFVSSDKADERKFGDNYHDATMLTASITISKTSSISVPSSGTPEVGSGSSSDHARSNDYKTDFRDGDDDCNNKKPAAVETPARNAVPVSSHHHAKTTEFSCVTSAYVQNLAEICHTIFEDRRWRVGNRRERLLAWELGDDLSAIIPLARRFRPWLLSSSVQDRRDYYCPGVFCSCQKQQQQQQNREAVDQPSVPDKTMAENNTPSQRHQIDDNTESETAEDRCMHFYCRMFYRKGPWFRIDDIYSRYYAPKKKAPQQSQNSSATGEATSEATEASSEKESQESDTSHSKQSFFNKKAAPNSKHKATTNKKDASLVINEDLFQQNLEALKLFFEDIIRLKEMGLIRTFCDEEECGKTVGWSRVLLTAEERRQVISKLGGGKNGAATANNKRRVSGTTGYARQEGRLAAAAAEENEIWKQMCQQKSISAQFIRRKQDSAAPGRTKSGSTVLLPVSRHVSHILLDKLASKIVQACSSPEYVAAPVMKTRKKVVKDFIVGLIGTRSGSSLESAIGVVGTCIRLREAPLKSLQRCARLYLCATSGPGQMRSDGTNGWRSIKEIDRRAVLNNTKIKNTEYASSREPPGAHSWHTVMFPGMQHRFGLQSTCFLEKYKPLPSDPLVESREEDSAVQVFFSRKAFQCWEICAEMRANVDYYIEINELVLYNNRKRAKLEARDQDIDMEDCEDSSEMDFLHALSPSGRRDIVSSFLALDTRSILDLEEVENVMVKIEQDVSLLFCVQDGPSRSLKTEWEEILCVMGVLIMHVLAWRIKSIPDQELRTLVSRPWLRHMSFEAGLAYILWDIKDIFERRGFHTLAIASLELLIQGRTMSLKSQSGQILGPPVDFESHDKDNRASAFARFLLSRRARGKALDRLVIDLTHFLRAREKKKALPKDATKKENAKRAKAAASAMKDTIAGFTRNVLSRFVVNAAVSFSSIRTLARRLKKPLPLILSSFPSEEAKELGLRLVCSDVSLTENSTEYSDWTPTTDYAVANSVAVGDAMAGGRCSFIGHEEDKEGGIPGVAKSLNVEQLAMEFYSSGRLPAPMDVDDSAKADSIQGGWVGWHDEGGLVRALFRVLSFEILGMDWGCQHGNTDHFSLGEESTIHLSPYQGAPHDLHVGYELADPVQAGKNDRGVLPNRGFFRRRQKCVQAFLRKLEGSSRQQMSDFVYNSVKARHIFMSSRTPRKDPSLAKDILQCRTLSMLAAGFGGEMVAAIFRCYFFDYRFYSGGLPDLLLVRAKFASTTTLVDLGDWIGEAFDAKYLAELEAHERASLLGDRDDDFLGCSKVGDSGGGGNSRNRTSSRSRPQPSKSACAVAPSIPGLPDRLELSHNGSPVDVECMFVEVKSLNDRLDARQEDWLNVLSKFGNARVCKFGDGKPKKNGKGKSSGKVATKAANNEEN